MAIASYLQVGVPLRGERTGQTQCGAGLRAIVVGDRDLDQTWILQRPTPSDGRHRDRARRSVQRLLGHAPDQHAADRSPMRGAQHQQVRVLLFGYALQRDCRSDSGDRQSREGHPAIEQARSLL